MYLLNSILYLRQVKNELRVLETVNLMAVAGALFGLKPQDIQLGRVVMKKEIFTVVAALLGVVAAFLGLLAVILEGGFAVLIAGPEAITQWYDNPIITSRVKSESLESKFEEIGTKDTGEKFTIEISQEEITSYVAFQREEVIIEEITSDVAFQQEEIIIRNVQIPFVNGKEEITIRDVQIRFADGEVHILCTITEPVKTQAILVVRAEIIEERSIVLTVDHFLLHLSDIPGLVTAGWVPIPTRTLKTLSDEINRLVHDSETEVDITSLRIQEGLLFITGTKLW